MIYKITNLINYFICLLIIYWFQSFLNKNHVWSSYICLHIRLHVFFLYVRSSYMVAWSLCLVKWRWSHNGVSKLGKCEKQSKAKIPAGKIRNVRFSGTLKRSLKLTNYIVECIYIKSLSSYFWVWRFLG